MGAYALLRPLLFTLPPETAHALALRALASGMVPPARLKVDPILRTYALRREFEHPLGLAAGFDKNARAVDALLACGFSFVEAGTVTPRPQAGNPRPRLFRLEEDRAIINRMGFPNEGADAVLARVSARSRNGILGINIGKNKDSTDAVRDYVTLLERFAPHADYITVNISSPNTPGLRELQNERELDGLLKAVMDARNALPGHVPVLVKIAPDLSVPQLEALVEILFRYEADGLIVTNTTVKRPSTLRSRYAQETGGLSGAPLRSSTIECLRACAAINPDLPLIGVGGISSTADAYTMIKSGAWLVQIYSALIYEGMGLVARIVNELPGLLRADGFSHISEALGAERL